MLKGQAKQVHGNHDLYGLTIERKSRNDYSIKRLGRKIALKRMAANLTQLQLAQLVNVTPPTIARIESGRAITARLEVLDRISCQLDMMLSELIALAED